MRRRWGGTRPACASSPVSPRCVFDRRAHRAHLWVFGSVLHRGLAAEDIDLVAGAAGPTADVYETLVERDGQGKPAAGGLSVLPAASTRALGYRRAVLLGVLPAVG